MSKLQKHERLVIIALQDIGLSVTIDKRNTGHPKVTATTRDGHSVCTSISSSPGNPEGLARSVCQNIRHKLAARGVTL